MPFDAYERSIELIGQLVAVLTKLEARDRDLARQLRRAAGSVALNIAEGRRRAGKDQRHHYRIAAGSAEEARACLQVAAAWGYVGEQGDAALATLDRLGAMLYRLTN